MCAWGKSKIKFIGTTMLVHRLCTIMQMINLRYLIIENNLKPREFTDV